MGKRRGKSGKEGELANFPEEQSTTILLSPRYLAVATSLLLVFSAFASLLIQQDITGQVTSDTLTRWRAQGLTDNWQQADSNVDTNINDNQGSEIVSEAYNCPEVSSGVSLEFASTSNSKGCYNLAQGANQFLPVCNYKKEVNGKITTPYVRCVRQ